MSRLVIKIIGGQGAGKTILAEEIYRLLKKSELYNSATIDLIDNLGNCTDEIDPNISIITEQSNEYN